MNKIYAKLIAITLALVLSVSVVVMSTYAWFVLSESPVVSGIQVTIGGGNTILIAPDIAEVHNGVTYHYPGVFKDNLSFSQHDSYAYLQKLGGLNPVSTADGVNWFLPAYYSASDKDVREGKVAGGQMKDIQDFLLDSELAYANLPEEQIEKIEEGSYIYLDFWVVSPAAGYTLRLSTGDDSGGSFVVDLMQPVSEVGKDTYQLAYPENRASTAVRIGFLANSYRITDDTMIRYKDSIYFNDQYTSLQGIYQEPNSGAAYLEGNRFTIFEPNADSHLENTGESGSYVATSPIALIDGVPTAQAVPERTTVQKTSTWAIAKTGWGTEIEQRFQAAVLNMDTAAMELSQIADAFYGSYLQGHIAPYVDKGDFITRTEDLYKYGESATAEQMAALDTGGATEDVYIINLEKNVPQRIRMFIWLEGQDVDCVDSVNSSNFAVSIELAGGSE